MSRKEKKDPQSASKPSLSVLNQRAKTSLGAGDIGGALQCAQQMKERFPLNASGYYMFAQCYHQQKKYIWAIAEYTWIINCIADGKNILTHYERAKNISKLATGNSENNNIDEREAGKYLNDDQYKNAKSSLKLILKDLPTAFENDRSSMLLLEAQANKKDPNQVYKISEPFRTGLSWLLNNMYTKAIDEFNLALKLKDQNNLKYLIYSYRGRAYFSLGDFVNAFIDFKISMHLNNLYILSHIQSVLTYFKIGATRQKLNSFLRSNVLTDLQGIDNPVQIISQAYYYLFEKDEIDFLRDKLEEKDPAEIKETKIKDDLFKAVVALAAKDTSAAYLETLCKYIVQYPCDHRLYRAFATHISQSENETTLDHQKIISDGILLVTNSGQSDLLKLLIFTRGLLFARAIDLDKAYKEFSRVEDLASVELHSIVAVKPLIDSFRKFYAIAGILAKKQLPKIDDTIWDQILACIEIGDWNKADGHLQGIKVENADKHPKFCFYEGLIAIGKYKNYKKGFFQLCIGLILEPILKDIILKEQYYKIYLQALERFRVDAKEENLAENSKGDKNRVKEVLYQPPADGQANFKDKNVSNGDKACVNDLSAPNLTKNKRSKRNKRNKPRSKPIPKNLKSHRSSQATSNEQNEQSEGNESGDDLQSGDNHDDTSSSFGTNSSVKSLCSMNTTSSTNDDARSNVDPNSESDSDNEDEAVDEAKSDNNSAPVTMLHMSKKKNKKPRKGWNKQKGRGSAVQRDVDANVASGSAWPANTVTPADDINAQSALDKVLQALSRESVARRANAAANLSRKILTSAAASANGNKNTTIDFWNLPTKRPDASISDKQFPALSKHISQTMGDEKLTKSRDLQSATPHLDWFPQIKPTEIAEIKNLLKAVKALGGTIKLGGSFRLYCLLQSKGIKINFIPNDIDLRIQAPSEAIAMQIQEQFNLVGAETIGQNAYYANLIKNCGAVKCDITVEKRGDYVSKEPFKLTRFDATIDELGKIELFKDAKQKHAFDTQKDITFDVLWHEFNFDAQDTSKQVVTEFLPRSLKYFLRCQMGEKTTKVHLDRLYAGNIINVVYKNNPYALGIEIAELINSNGDCQLFFSTVKLFYGFSWLCDVSNTGNYFISCMINYITHANFSLDFIVNQCISLMISTILNMIQKNTEGLSFALLKEAYPIIFSHFVENIKNNEKCIDHQNVWPVMSSCLTAAFRSGFAQAQLFDYSDFIATILTPSLQQAPSSTQYQFGTLNSFFPQAQLISNIATVEAQQSNTAVTTTITSEEETTSLEK